MKLGSNWRVGAELGGDRWTQSYVTVVGNTDASTYADPKRERLLMSASQARAMAIRLRKAADLIDPPKRRRAS